MIPIVRFPLNIKTNRHRWLFAILIDFRHRLTISRQLAPSFPIWWTLDEYLIESVIQLSLGSDLVYFSFSYERNEIVLCSVFFPDSIGRTLALDVKYSVVWWWINLYVRTKRISWWFKFESNDKFTSICSKKLNFGTFENISRIAINNPTRLLGILDVVVIIFEKS